jgi:hypothetical protein
MTTHQQHRGDDRALRILRLLGALGEPHTDTLHSVLDRAEITGWGTLLPAAIAQGHVEQARNVFNAEVYRLTPAGRAVLDRDLYTPCPLCGRS